MMNPSASLSHLNLAWLLAFLLFLGLIAAGVFYGRNRALAIYGSGDAQAQWDTWRAGAKKMAEAPHPVKRRIPGSAEPPALVLMRDYFAICLGGSLVLSTVLFGTFMVLVSGAMNESRRVGQGRDSVRRPTN